MDHFHYRNRVLHCEEVPVPKLAETYDTPLFVYSRRTLLHHLNQLKRAFAGAEPFRALKTGGTGNQIVFAGVGKTAAELRYGLENNVLMFNVESEAELMA